jgi:hypothetical protein
MADILTIVLIALAAGVIFVMGSLYGAIRADRRWAGEVERYLGLAQAQKAEEYREVLRQTRGSATWRAEVAIEDWGVDQGEMRWRWTIWDADRALLVMIDPATQALGIEIPVMLGNSATKIAALREAVLWVNEQGAKTIVLTEQA